MNSVIIKFLALSLLPIGIDATISWKDLTEMRKSTPRYIAKQKIKQEKKNIKLTKQEKKLIKNL